MTTLAEVRDGAAEGIDLLAVRRNKPLCTEVQTELGRLGLLDPPADGDFGPVTTWAWGRFCDRCNAQDRNHLTAALARTLLSDEPWPLDTSGDDLAARALRSMQALGYWIARHPDCLNIVYLEGTNPDGSRNDNATNGYNDLRCAIAVQQGTPRLLGCWPATTQPGWHWILDPPQGIPDPVKAAAQIALGQFKAWCVGIHHGHVDQEALVQRARIRIYRDRNKDGKRDGDPMFERADYGINQHHGSNSRNVDRFSAGCLVGQRVDGHEAFMRLLKSDPRYRASNAYLFMTAVIGVDQLLA